MASVAQELFQQRRRFEPRFIRTQSFRVILFTVRSTLPNAVRTISRDSEPEAMP
jgi:hypothetical protein